jgi:ADP-heptose:LPS heptosyltransferase
VIRADRLGDLVLSTPVFQALRRATPAKEVFALVHINALPLVEHNPYLSGIIAYDPKVAHRGIAGLFRLVRELRKYRFDGVVLLQVQFKLALAVFLARIKKRVGPLSKLYSYLLFNGGLRQKRSRVEMHEADYNLMLLRAFGVRIPSRQYDPEIVVDANAKERVRTWLKDAGLNWQDDPFVLVHPGMGGSALNWPEGYYLDLVYLLTQRGKNVLLGGGTNDMAVLDRIESGVLDRLKEKSVQGSFKGRLLRYQSSEGYAGLSDYIALVSMAQVIVAPSTGPLHIACALGRPTVSFYPPIRVQSALRWGPYVHDDSAHAVFVPDALCGRDYKCAGAKCAYYFCMERLSVEDAVNAVFRLSESRRPESHSISKDIRG